MEVTLTDQDRHAIAEEVYQMIKADQHLKNRSCLIGLEQFRRQYGHNKAAAWIKLYLLPKMPGVFGLNCGRGHPVKIDVEKATRWLSQHEEEIDWNQPLPR